MGWISRTWKKYVWNPIKKIGKKVIKGVGDFFSGVANFVGSLFGWNMAPDPGDTTIDQQQGTTVTKQGGDHVIPLIYSNNQSKIGGHLVHMSTSGTDNKFLHLTYVLAYGEAASVVIRDAEFNNGAVALARWRSGSGSVGPTNYGDGADHYAVGVITSPSGQGSGNSTTNSNYYVNRKFYGQFFVHNGGLDDAVTDYSPDWHNDKKVYKGLVFAKIKLEWPSDLNTNENRIPFTGLPQFDFRIEKHAMHRVNNTNNVVVHPVNILYDLLRNSTYGLGINKIYIDSTSFAELLDEDRNDVPYYGLRKGGYGQNYRFDSGKSVVSNIKSMLYAMGCTLIWKNNKFYLKPNPNFADRGTISSTKMTALNINTHTVAEADCIGGIAYETPPQDSKYKSVELNHMDDEEVFTDITSIDEDTFPYKGLVGYLQSRIDENATAKKTETIVGPANLRLGDVLLLESHYGSTISLTLGAKHSNIEVYDIIDVTYPRANLSSAKYVVLDVEHTSLETVNIRAVRYLYDNDAEGLSTRDVMARTWRSEPKKWLAVPTGFGLDNNTQVDQFLSQQRVPSTITSLRIITSRDFFIKKVAGNGQLFHVNRAKIEWEIAGDPNNTRYTVQLKKEGEQSFDTLFDTNETFTFIENLEDTTSYYVRIVPKNQSGYGIGRVNKFTTLDSSTLQTVPINYEFTVTDENGNGEAKKVAGASADLDTYVSSGNPFASSYTAGTYQPYGFGESSVAGTTVTDTYKDHIATTTLNGLGAATCWNDLDWNQNGGAGSRTDNCTTNTFNPSDLRPGAYADEAAWNAAVGTWGGTKHTANQYGELQWLSYNKTALLATLSASNRGTTLTGKTVDTGSSKDWYFEGRVELAPDDMLPLDQDSYAFGSGGSVLYEVAKSDSMFVYMYSSDTNDAIDPPVWSDPSASGNRFNSYKPGSAPNRLTDWDTATGDSRLYDSGYGYFTITKAFDSKYGTSAGSNADRKWGQAWPVNEGRYVTPILVSNQEQNQATYGIRNYDFKLKRDFHRMVFRNIDTSTLSGSVNARTFTWTTARFGRIKDVIINTNNASSNNVIGYLTADPVDNVQSITIKCIETQNNNAVDANVDIIIEGFPEVVHVTETDHLGNIRAVEYKNNFDGTLTSV